MQTIVTPRALRTDEMAGIVADYRHAAVCAKRAGFDGVEIHAANGYLIDQFLRTGSNTRTDTYGGPVENRVRLLVEVAEAVIYGMGRRPGGRAVRADQLPPTTSSDADPQTTFGAAVGADGPAGTGLHPHHRPDRRRGRATAFPGFDFAKPLRRAFRGLYMRQQRA